MCKVGQGFKFATFMADVEGLIAAKDIFKEVVCHFPVGIFLARRIPECLDCCKLRWIEFCSQLMSSLYLNRMLITHVEPLLHVEQHQLSSVW